MPTTRKRTARFQQDWLTQNHIDWLYNDREGDDHDWFIWDWLDNGDPRLTELDTLDPPRATPFLESAVTGGRLWAMYGADIVAEHVQENPGTRPMRWWQFDAPEPRQRVGGIGTLKHEALPSGGPHPQLGVPSQWIVDSDIRVYVLIGRPLGVPAVDADDPPTYESQATYLKRLGLLLPGEAKRLKPKHFRPESVIDMGFVETIETEGQDL